MDYRKLGIRYAAKQVTSPDPVYIQNIRKTWSVERIAQWEAIAIRYQKRGYSYEQTQWNAYRDVCEGWIVELWGRDDKVSRCIHKPLATLISKPEVQLPTKKQRRKTKKHENQLILPTETHLV